MEPSEGQAPRVGFVIVLLGCAAFVVSCFLPFYESEFGRQSFTTSFYRATVLLPVSFAAHIGGFLTLFAGVIVIASISGFGLRTSRSAAKVATVALLAAVVVWALTWIGVVLQTYELAQSHGIGYWTLTFSVAVVVAGAIVASKGLTSDRRSIRVDVREP